LMKSDWWESLLTHFLHILLTTDQHYQDINNLSLTPLLPI
jgi:hypothetical protein